MSGDADTKKQTSVEIVQLVKPFKLVRLLQFNSGDKTDMPCHAIESKNSKPCENSEHSELLVKIIQTLNQRENTCYNYEPLIRNG